MQNRFCFSLAKLVWAGGGIKQQQYSWIMKQPCFETTGFCHETSPSRCDSSSDNWASSQGCKLFKYKWNGWRVEGQLIGNADDVSAPCLLTSSVRMAHRERSDKPPDGTANISWQSPKVPLKSQCRATKGTGQLISPLLRKRVATLLEILPCPDNKMLSRKDLQGGKQLPANDITTAPEPAPSKSPFPKAGPLKTKQHWQLHRNASGRENSQGKN